MLCYLMPSESANSYVFDYITYSNLTNICLLFELFHQECHFPETTASNFVCLIVFFFLHLLLAVQCLDMSYLLQTDQKSMKNIYALNVRVFLEKLFKQ